MKLETRVFELSNGKYASIAKLAEAMGMSPHTVYKVRMGIRGISQGFIIGALKAFPEYKFEDLFYMTQITMPPRAKSPAEGSGPESVARKHNRGQPSYAEIARRLGISRERVRQIVNRQRARQLQAPVKYEVDRVAEESREMLTTSEVARFLNVHPNTARRWAQEGTLKAYRISPRGDRRFYQRDVDDFLKKGEIGVVSWRRY